MAYATAADFRALGLPCSSVEEFDDVQIEAHLNAQAGMIDTYLTSRYTLPLSAPYPQALVAANVYLAVCSLLLWRGYNPEQEDDLYSKRCDSVKAWLVDVASGKVSIPGINDVTPGVNDAAPVVITQALRGW